MKKLFWAGLACLSLVLSHGAEAEWLTDFKTAKAKAKEENKMLLMDFTGSDWCVWCKKLHAEVFTKPEFTAYAKDNLVLLLVDFPQDKPLPPAQQKANDKLSEDFSIEGYPTIIVLNAKGKKVGKLGYMEGGPKPFIAALDKLKKK